MTPANGVTEKFTAPSYTEGMSNAARTSFRPWWPFAALALLVAIFDPYIYPKIIGPSWFFAKLVLFCVLACAAGLVKNERLEPRLAARLCAAIWVGLPIFLSNSITAIGVLPPLGILAIAQWGGAFPEPAADNTDNMVAILPDWAREALAFALMLMGTGLGLHALDLEQRPYFETAYRDIGYIAFFVAAALCAISLMVVLTEASRRNMVSAVLYAYASALILNCALTIMALLINSDASYIAEAKIVGPISAMLLVQVARHFHRPDALSKIGETYLGGMVIAVTAIFVLPLSKNSNFFALFFLPALLLAIPVMLFGLYLVWRKDSWLSRLL